MESLYCFIEGINGTMYVFYWVSVHESKLLTVETITTSLFSHVQDGESLVCLDGPRIKSRKHRSSKEMPGTQAFPDCSSPAEVLFVQSDQQATVHRLQNGEDLHFLSFLH